LGLTGAAVRRNHRRGMTASCGSRWTRWRRGRWTTRVWKTCSPGVLVAFICVSDTTQMRWSSEHLPVYALFDVDVLQSPPKYDVDNAPCAIVFADLACRCGASLSGSHPHRATLINSCSPTGTCLHRPNRCRPMPMLCSTPPF
jgi:hypothetical protein